MTSRDVRFEDRERGRQVTQAGLPIDLGRSAGLDGREPVQRLQRKGVLDRVGEPGAERFGSGVGAHRRDHVGLRAPGVGQFGFKDPAAAARDGEGRHLDQAPPPAPGQQQCADGPGSEAKGGEGGVLGVGLDLTRKRRVGSIATDRFGGGGDCRDCLDRAALVLDLVQPVHPQVDGRPAAAAQFLVPPGGVADDVVRGPVGMAHHPGQDHAHRADSPGFDGPVAGAAVGLEAGHLGRRQHHRGAVGGLDHPAAGSHGDGQRLLDEDVLAGLRQRHADFVMGIQRREHDRGVDVLVGDHLPVVVVDGGRVRLEFAHVVVAGREAVRRRVGDRFPGRDAVFRGPEHQCVLDIPRAEGGDREIGEPAVLQQLPPAQVGVQDTSAADDGDAQ